MVALTWTAPYSRPSIAASGLTSRSNLARRVDLLVETGRSELGLPGVSIAIMRGHELVFAKGYGLADRESGVAPSEQTVYPIGSLSKQFTAAAVMKLVEQGRVGLEEPVATYLPEFRASQTPMLRVRHLLSQTSGIPEFDGLPELEGIDTGDSAKFTLAKLVEILGRQPQLYPPGDWWSYSNSNYLLLAAVIERVTGKTYEQYLTETLFRPLRLRSTGSCQPEQTPTASSQFAVGYEAVQGSFKLRPLTANTARVFIGSGGICSNAADLVSWMRALVDGRAVGATSFRQMTATAPVRAGFTPPYGFGLSMLPLAGEPAVWHMGVLAGFTSVLAYFPKQELIIAILTNSRHVPLQTLLRKVSRAVMSLREPELRDLPIKPAEVSRWVGSYDDGMFKFRIFEQSGQLYIHVPELGSPERLRYQGRGEFLTAEPGMIRLWFEPATGRAERVVWEWGGTRAYGRRAK